MEVDKIILCQNGKAKMESFSGGGSYNCPLHLIRSIETRELMATKTDDGFSQVSMVAERPQKLQAPNPVQGYLKSLICNI